MNNDLQARMEILNDENINISNNIDKFSNMNIKVS